MSVKREKIIYLSPVALLTLSACGGNTGASLITNTVNGSVVKGPLSNALVFLDLNSNGIRDGNETAVRTDANGKFSISTTATDYKIIAYTDDSTVDTSSGSVLSGITLSAPKNAAVITPTTTLMEEGGLTAAQVAEVLNLPDDIDPLSFNPFAAGVDATKALAVEKISQQIMTAINSFAAAAEGAGVNETGAFEAALNSVVDVVKVKAGKLNDAGVSTADKTIDFTKASDLNLIKVKIADEAEKIIAEGGAHGPNGFTKSAITNLIDDTATSIKNVNDQITKLTEIGSDAAKATFSNSQVLVDQVKSAAQAEKTSSGTGTIDFVNLAKVEKAAKNKTPTDITLSSDKIFEGAENLIVGKLNTIDLDQPNGQAFKYSLAEVSGTDYSAFEIDQLTGDLSLKSQPNFATKSSYILVVQSTDDGGKTISKTFEIGVKSASSKINVNEVSADQLTSLSGDLNDKTLLVVIDDFSSRVHDYDNTTLYDYGLLEVVTYIDNYTNIYTGQTTSYGTFDDYYVDVPDYTGGFYLTSPDSDSTYLVDRDLISKGQFTDVLGNLAKTETYLEFSKLGQQSEVGVLHGDWVVEAICQTLIDPSKTEIVCIDVDAYSDGRLGPNFAKLFQPTSFVLGDASYTASGVEQVLSEFLYQNDARFNGGSTKDVYEITGISMSISGIPNLNEQFFLKDLEDYKIPFFQSAPNVNQGKYNYANFFPNVISVGAWNVDANNYILAADVGAIPHVDLYANGYVTKTGWGEIFGTSFATPTAAAEFTNYINEIIKQLNESGKNIVDIQLSNEEIAQIDYTDLINSVVSSISSPVSTEYSLNNQIFKNTVQVLNETLINDGLNPTLFNKSGYGLEGVSFVKASYSGSDNLGGTIKNNEVPVKIDTNEADVSGPTFSDFSIITSDLLSGGHLTVRFKMSDPSGFGEHSVNINFKNSSGTVMVNFNPKNFTNKSDGLIEAISDKVVLPVDKNPGTFEIELIQMRDNLGNWTAFTKDSSFISNLTNQNKQIKIENKRETEPNNTQDTPNKLKINEVVSGNISNRNDFDYYSFSLDKRSQVDIDFFVSKDQNETAHKHYFELFDVIEGNIETQIIDLNGRIEKQLDPGDYLVRIGQTFDDADYSLALDIEEEPWYSERGGFDII